MAKLLNGRGKVVMIAPPVVTSVQDRTKDFMEAISKYPGIQVVDRPPGDGAAQDDGGHRDHAPKTSRPCGHLRHQR